MKVQEILNIVEKPLAELRERIAKLEGVDNKEAFGSDEVTFEPSQVQDGTRLEEIYALAVNPLHSNEFVGQRVREIVLLGKWQS